MFSSLKCLEEEEHYLCPLFLYSNLAYGPIISIRCVKLKCLSSPSFT